MVLRFFFLILGISLYLAFGETNNSLIALYLIVVVSAIYHFFVLDNIFDLRIWFVPLFTFTNSLAILSEDYLLKGVNILPSYSPSKIIISLYLFNIFIDVFFFYFTDKISDKNEIDNDNVDYKFSYKKVYIILFFSYIYFIFDFIRLGGFSQLEKYGEDQYDYSIFNVFTSLFTLIWAIGLILVSISLKSIQLWLWFLVNFVFIIFTKVLVGYRYFVVFFLIIVLFRIVQGVKLNKLLLFLLGVSIFCIHGTFGLYRAGTDITIENILFQIGLEFSIISQINYLVFNEFHNFKYGYSLLSSFINIFPGARLLFGDYIFYPALYFNTELIQKKENMGYGFSFLSELYMNFGIFGSIFASFIFVYFNSLINSVYGSIKWILAPILIYLLTRILRSDSVEFIKMFSYAYFILLFLKDTDKQPE